MTGRKFTVEYTVDETLLEDGFTLTDELALEMLSYALPFAEIDTELSAKVIKTEDIK